MKRLALYVSILLIVAIPAVQTNATIDSVSGPNSSAGTPPEILVVLPSSVVGSSDAGGAYNTGQQGFDEAQDVLLASDLAVDGGTIPAGTYVDSHMIFMKQIDSDLLPALTHDDVEWTFSGEILGVMSDNGGTLEAASSSFLGSATTTYPGTGFANRGLETDPVHDDYQIAGNVLTFSTLVTQPGDWIRVITKGTPPEPCTEAHTHGYWKNHPDDWPVDTIDLGCKEYTKAEAIELISKPVKGDKSLSLFQQLVAAMLSVADGSCAPCVPDLIADAIAWQCDHLPGSQVKGDSDAWHNIEMVHDQLDAFVNNNLKCD